jgi:general L-amino acid transport system substrate-binding protein
MKRLLAAASLTVAALALPTVVAAQGTLQKVKDRGQVRCGASQGVAGFSMPDAQGNWTGFDTDFCRALAAAIFDDPKRSS